ncbi:hypothetical protein CcI49_03210 [Frankia sp. CcI49]|uniref:DUF6011 domain-containing protein n=1 Tax=Frankia sp. CcI49 TaxID=1745382 RepID=UPI0009756A9D|nr:DUF6011 domain-containing protein [Frankia sp. CcI49]ONH62402.1 hypothetical protein CcI49_03210 [Frankia sp. CcI49]
MITQESIRCKGCNRPLHAEASRTAGYGRTCACQAALIAEGYSASQVEKALELVELGGVVHLSGAGNDATFATVGSRGANYHTDAHGRCDCPAGQHGRRCHHAAAVRLVTTSTREALRTVTTAA